MEQVSNKDDMKTSLKKVVKEVGTQGQRGALICSWLGPYTCLRSLRQILRGTSLPPTCLFIVPQGGMGIRVGVGSILGRLRSEE